MYKVIKDFTDLKDKGYFYTAGDKFPRDGTSVSKERLSELLSSNNRQKTPLIEIISNDAHEMVEEKPKRRKST